MRDYLKKKLPNANKVSQIKSLQRFNITRNFLWNFSRRKVAGAFFIGFFWMMIPMPFQMVPATITAIYFGANLPIALALVWITNPLTMPFIFYANYRLGVFILGGDPISFGHLQGWQSVLAATNPLLLGSLISGMILGIVGYLAVSQIYIRIVRRSQYKRALNRYKVRIEKSEQNSK